LSTEATKIRELISSLELCHHKADRWIDNIIQAIGAGETGKGPGTRPPEARHPVEEVWMHAVAALTAWCAGCPGARIDLTIDDLPASRLLAGLGERSPLKEWQVQRVIEKICSVIRWSQSNDDPSAQYTWILLGGGEYEAAYRSDCPEHYEEHEDFWLTTVRTILHDTDAGDEAALSLGLAIDMLWPCHRSFVENLQIVMDAIGGNLHPREPFAACGRNIARVANRARTEQISRTLGVFCGNGESGEGVDPSVLEALGAPSPVKKWLAASLDKTIRLQLHPPADVRAASALTGPDWIR
ncbi:MAG: hypothetical protein ACYTFD_04850, partial [Planctomycetota bacterium]